MREKHIFFRRLSQDLTVLLFLLILYSVAAHAQTYFSDDFEKGLDKWIVSGQDWALITSSYVSPNHSITESPTSNYKKNSNATITMSGNVNIFTATFPVLTFWHKYSINFYDSIIVEISKDGGFTWSKIHSWYSNEYQSTWTLQQIDLRNYKATSAKIRFRLRAEDNYEADGWFIDDVQIKERDDKPKLTLTFFDNFENGINNWITSGSDWSLDTTTSLSANHSITDSPGGNYPDNSNATLTLKGYADLSSTTLPVLYFWHKYSINKYDSIIVEISKDGGFKWTKLIGWYSNKYQSDWTQEQIDLRNHKASNVKIRFRLRAEDDYEADGWYIDDVKIEDIGNHPPLIDSFTASPTFGYAPLTVTFTCQAHDPNGQVVAYRWDFNGDGQMDDNTQSNSTSYIYNTKGTYQAKCTVVDNQGAITTSSAVTITVSETQAKISVAPTSHNFGYMAIGSSSPPLELTISNIGTANLNVSGMALSETINFILDVNGGSNPCGSTTPTIVPGSSRTLTITFMPKSIGVKTSALTITSNDPSTVNIPLTGESFTPNLAIPDTSARPGEKLDIPITLSNATGIAGAQITVTYDPNILTALDAQTTTLSTGFNLADSISTGKIAISLARATGITGGSGNIVDIRFQVSATGTIGSTCSLVLKTVSLFDQHTNPILTTSQNGSFTIKSPYVLKRIDISPESAKLNVGETQDFHATGFDTLGNRMDITPGWRVAALDEIGFTHTVGQVIPATGASTIFTATRIGDGRVIASHGLIADTASVLVTGTAGDINADSTIDVRDAIICLRIIVGLALPPYPPGHPTPTPYERWAADIKIDGEINSADALLILYQSVGRLISLPRLLADRQLEAVMIVPEIFATAGEEVTVPIIAENGEGISAADFKLCYDASSLTVLEVQPGVNNSLLSVNTQNPGQITAALVNLNGLVNPQGEIVRVKFKSEKPILQGIYLSLVNVKLFDDQANSIHVQISKQEKIKPVILPKGFSLFQNYPNPFNPETIIRYYLPWESQVSLRIYNMQGQLIRKLVDNRFSPGEWATTWDGKDEQGKNVANGFYFYQIQINNGIWTDVKKMILMQ